MCSCTCDVPFVYHSTGISFRTERMKVTRVRVRVAWFLLVCLNSIAVSASRVE